MLTAAQREHLRVVLVSPRNPLNIGAVARAMANFGFADLAVAAPYLPHWREARSAVGAPHLLTDAREFDTLQHAVADCTFVIGTGTLTHRKPDQPVVSLHELAPVLHRRASGGRAALVLGPEKHGLTRDDLSWCHVLVEIPTDPRQPSMNLGQAAAVCLYELARPEPQADAGQQLEPAEESAESMAASGLLDRLAALVEETTLAAEYSPASMAAANRHDARTLLRKIGLSSLETRRLMGLFRRILWQLKKSPRAE